ncbi:hypothetical protein PAPYR_6005 [Paratrimastix pyriformis]|uniref:Uncharacterized protein n=1 Tax=Paratrimastix pyriformis TaxID=342808 RepID=A0ABQ8UGD1_9EUKA|nr:hypothetical protein PAPYR_6005 [Paratrimastix pyriformis]
MDQKWLQENVGEVLSSALSAVVISMPSDPIEYLALWLLRHAANEERRAMEKAERDEIARKIAEYQAQKAAEEAERLRLAQEKEEQERQEKLRLEREEEERFLAYQQAEEERRRQIEEQLAAAEAERLEKLAAIEAGQEDVAPPAPLDPLEKYRLRYGARLQDLGVLDQNFINEIHRYATPPVSVYKVLKALFYLLGKQPKDVDDWSKIRTLVNGDLLATIQGFDPIKKYKPKRFKLCVKTLAGFSAEDARKGSYPAFLIYQWVVTTLDLRAAAVAQRKAEAEKEGKAAEVEDAGVAPGELEGMEPPEEPQPAEGENPDDLGAGEPAP